MIATSRSQATSKVFVAQHSLALRNVGRIRKYLDQTSTERPVHLFLFKQTFCQLPVTDHRTSLILFYFDFSLSSLFLILKTISDRHRKFHVHLILVPFNLLKHFRHFYKRIKAYAKSLIRPAIIIIIIIIIINYYIFRSNRRLGMYQFLSVRLISVFKLHVTRKFLSKSFLFFRFGR